MKSLLLLQMLTAIVFLTACQTQQVKPDKTISAQENSNLTNCPEPRPQICTMIYDPVCATLTDGQTETKASDCSACGDSEVVGYVHGACENL
jgi:hypothetical protein